MSHTLSSKLSNKEYGQSTWKAGSWNHSQAICIIKNIENYTQKKLQSDIGSIIVKLAYICISPVFGDRAWINK